MILTNLQAREILEAPPHALDLKACKLHESALRVFTEELDIHEIGHEPYWHVILKTINARLSDTKFKRLFDFIRYPLPVAQLTDSIIGEFYRVFEGKNKFFNLQGDRDLTQLEDWIKDKDLETWIEDNARKVFKNKPCSFVLIDRTDMGGPKCVFLDSSRIIDVLEKPNGEGRLEYIAFIHSVTTESSHKTITRLAVYDDLNYHIFIKQENGTLLFDEKLSSQHEIGYTPAIFFIQESNNSKNIYKRRTAFSASVSKLEDWTIFDVFRNYTDHYAPFPVTESVVTKCGNDQCENGVVKVEETLIDGPRKGTPVFKNTRCPICKGKGASTRFIGPGTHIGIKHQQSKTMEDASGKFRMIFPDTDKLKYVPEKLDDIEIEIRLKTVGTNNILTKEAVNQLQAKGSFLSMETVLLRNKKILDSLYVFIVTTAGNMIYTNLNITVTANYGTEFHLVSEEDLQNRFSNAKKIGLPINEVTSIYRQLVETKYSNNKAQRDREIMLVDIQDLPFFSIEESIVLKNESVIDDFQLSLKTNFFTFVQRFERENGTITMFGLNLELEKRVEIIRETFFDYNIELLTAKNKRTEQQNTDHLNTEKNGENKSK